MYVAAYTKIDLLNLRVIYNKVCKVGYWGSFSRRMLVTQSINSIGSYNKLQGNKLNLCIVAKSMTML